MNARPARFAENRFLQIVLVFYAVFWIALAIRPVHRGDWFLENLLVFATFAVLGLTWRKFQFSNFSYLMLALFLTLHAIGAHYTYAEVPIGFWVRDFLHLSRNHFDRVIHFGFGFLVFYPLRELLVRSGGARGSWGTWFGLAGIFALSSFFEILEAIIVMIVHPELGETYLGTQGDMWDAQKDMACAFAGALLAALLLARGRPKSQT
jgi:putative membrane protein